MFESRSLLTIETRKDFAVHVSLSSSLLVKQPGTRRSHEVQNPRVSTSAPTLIGALLSIRRQLATDDCRLLITHRNDEAFRGAEARWGPVGCSGAALSGWFIGQALRICQRPSSEKCRVTSENHFPSMAQGFPGRDAVLKPHSSVVLPKIDLPDSSGCLLRQPGSARRGSRS